MTTQAPAWQPIETAPKRQSILVYDEEWDATLGAIQIGCLEDDGICRVPETDDFHPTHWMELPEPPASGETADAAKED